MAVNGPDRVLIVDDHSLVRDGLRSIFDDAFPSCTILEADSLEAALNTLEQEGDVDLVLLDLNIPDVSHLSGLEALRDRFPATPVVMVSGVTDRKVVRDALAALDVTTFYGPIKFSANGMNQGSQLPIIQVQKGRIAVLFPERVKQGNLQIIK